MRGGGRTFPRSAFLAAFAFLGLLGGVAARPAEGRWTVLLSGDADGLLAPCGCTNPQEGGLKRRTTALRGGDERTVRLDNGGLAGGTGPQPAMKAQTAAMALDLAGIDAANLGAADARLGGEALSLVRLSGGRLVSTSLQAGEGSPLAPWRAAGPFLVGGATTRPTILGTALGGAVLPPDEAAHRLAAESAARGLVPVMLFDGGLDAARAIARAEPALRLVTYRSTGRPPSTLARERECAFATPGEHGKAVVRLAWDDGAFALTKVDSLGPDYRDDPAATALYRAYLGRVTKAGLMDKAPHVPTAGFAGTARCGSCHGEAARVGSASGHAHALATLEKVGNDRDPECAPCHVVGQAKGEGWPTMAFRSRATTPTLANVGCESCHGAGAAHAASPWKVRLPKVGERSCLPCHASDNSPEFAFSTYWPKVRHGMGGTKGKRP